MFTLGIVNKHMNGRIGNPSKNYKSITVSHKEHCFTVFCTAHSLDTRHDEVKAWVDRLSRRLGWRDPSQIIKDAFPAEAEERPDALFDSLYPSDSK